MLVTKPYLIETASFYAGTSEEVHLRGQIYTRELALTSITSYCVVVKYVRRRSVKGKRTPVKGVGPGAPH